MSTTNQQALTALVTEASDEPQRCQNCNERLQPHRIVWLELSFRTGNYYAYPGVPDPTESQGWFPFGAACARKVATK